MFWIHVGHDEEEETQEAREDTEDKEDTKYKARREEDRQKTQEQELE